MNKTSKMLIMRVLLVFVVFSIIACDTDDDLDRINTNTNAVSDFLSVSNGLVISLFTDDGEDETAYFEGYVFLFDANGTVSASNGNMTVNGTYSVFSDDGRIELEMDFPNVGEFDELDDDWYYISTSQNTIRFDDDGDVIEFEQR